MVIKVYEDKASLGRAAAEQAAVSLCNAIQGGGEHESLPRRAPRSSNFWMP